MWHGGNRRCGSEGNNPSIARAGARIEVRRQLANNFRPSCCTFIEGVLKVVSETIPFTTETVHASKRGCPLKPYCG